MSLPVVLPGSCCSVTGASVASQWAEPSYRSRPRCISSSRMPGSQSRIIPALLPRRPLLSLGLLQLLLGCSMVALSFGALSLSSSPPIRSSCPFWAGSSVILSGIVGLTTWRRPMLLLVNMFVLLSVVCVLLNLAGFILCCQGAQLVSSMSSCQLSEAGDACLCCPLPPLSSCPEDKLLLLHPGHSCNTMKILLKKVLFALCALNALTAAVCLVAAALRYLQILTTPPPLPGEPITSVLHGMDEPRSIAEEGEEPSPVPDPDEFVPPAPPPSYFSTFYSYTPRLARRMFGDSVMPLPHISRIKGGEVFCPLDPPPPYEAVVGSSPPPPLPVQEAEMDLEEQREGAGPGRSTSGEHDTAQPNFLHHPRPRQSGPPPSPPLHHPRPPQPRPPPSSPPLGPPQPGLVPPTQTQRLHRSNSDPVLVDLAAKVLSCEAAKRTTDSSTQTSQCALASQPQTVTLRRGPRAPRRPRPSSMVDHQSYRQTQQLVSRFLEQPSACGLAPEVQELVDSIRSVLRSDQEHMEEAVRCASYIEQVCCASYIEQVITGSETVSPANQPPLLPRLGPTPPQAGSSSQTLPLRKRPGLLHLHSCGDLSTFTWAELRPLARRGAGSRAGGARLDHERPHSLIGVFRETVL
ncbi:protein FAM189A2 [Hypomesus transpacificus]|uniref:protein FAM189A2 n=1 Tax=Hypomesus transpacificus TaxID=137520 RepID=UPI001F07A69B|nr:protein FAM189A2 [Hypomesus transpacificus]